MERRAPSVLIRSKLARAPTPWSKVPGAVSYCTTENEYARSGTTGRSHKNHEPEDECRNRVVGGGRLRRGRSSLASHPRRPDCYGECPARRGTFRDRERCDNGPALSG